MFNSIFRWIGVLLLVIGLSGCGSRINQANYDKIQDNMTEAQVEAVLGKPTETSSSAILGITTRSSTWKDKNGTISVQFLNGKVKMRNFEKAAPKS